METKSLFKSGTLTLGVNYLASNAAIRMWSEWDESVVRADIARLAELGCQILRVFPIWSDFQPVMILRTNCFKGGRKRGYAFVGERPLPDTEAGRAGVDEVMMERFETLCDIAHEHGIRMIVPLINGHLTFRIFNPPAVDGLDHFTDPESLMWQGKFVRYFVKRMKNHPAIAAWELGNESNCLSVADERSTAWTWTAFITGAIRSQDSSRPISSGMHHLALHKTGKTSWTFTDQAELCDILTAHPYPMWRDYINCDKPNTLRWALHCPIETQLYADISGKESFAEEVGTLRRTFSDFESLGKQLTNILWMLWSCDARALLWWCAFDQKGMEFPPYDWDEAGMEHGILTADYKLNPTGKAISDFIGFVRDCPVKELRQPEEKAVCILGRDQMTYEIAISTGILAKQAGIALRYTFCESELPESPVYLIPCALRKGGLNRAAYRKLAEKIEAGATVYMSLDYNTMLPEMPEFLGLEIISREQNSSPITLKLESGELRLNPKYRFSVRSHGATALDDEGILWEFKRGKGRIITAMLPLETMLLSQKDSYTKYPAYEIYQNIGRELLDKRIITSGDPDLIITEHPSGESTLNAIICNCSPELKKAAFTLKDGWKITALHSIGDTARFCGDELSLDANSGALAVIEKL